ncbi:hypothetical protein [Staphylococcus kloosii]|uniref:Yip1 domain-containing protein n=3 Tax=Staphylococcus kloosii TaxID=29384 RepID=A0ABQ0XKL9_9STAP|nr:hypothetical protein [Staphylococcus kloosii]AVQ34747.1 hypothetical protein C7J89_00790 [Staphylococcus kloosii]GEP81972.1 hypothetical protein SKL01_11500 [Staphylococcus kloosii]SUM50304.1 Uncharacterised protein [Staphylococcus kloosii]
MKKLKLKNDQIVYSLLFFIIFTITIQISTRSILLNEVENLSSDIPISTDLAVLWMNLILVIFSVIAVIILSLILKFIVGFIGTKQNFSIGMNLYIYISSILPSFITISLVTYFNNGISVIDNEWLSILSIILNSALYSILLRKFSIIEKREAIITFVVMLLLNILIAILKFI